MSVSVRPRAGRGAPAKCQRARMGSGAAACAAFNYSARCASPLRGRRVRGVQFGQTAELVVHQEAAQLFAAAGVTQLAQRFSLYLTNPLARHVELLADFL